MKRFCSYALARRSKSERGVTILLVAVALLFMIVAIAAIAIDVGAMLNARGEAKHAADAAALAGAKVLADSGLTSDPTNGPLKAAAILQAIQVATSVATQNNVGGRQLNAGEVSVNFPNSGNILQFEVAPQVSVTVQRTDFPTFFAKAWGRSTVAVGATSAAEAVNPSGSASVSGNQVLIAPSCVKPWIIPNKNPNVGAPFFNPDGSIYAANGPGGSLTLSPGCPLGGCNGSPPAPPGPAAYTYLPAAMTAPPASQQPACTPSSCTNSYEETIAACSPDVITCGVSNNATVDLSNSCSNYYASTNNAASCLIHSTLGQDTISVGGTPPLPPPPLAQPMEFDAGAGNPLVVAGKAAAGTQVSSSDSLVTIPVYDNGNITPAVNIIGFIQGFIQSTDATGHINLVVVNLAGCGSGAAYPPIAGNGMSPVPVHLITPP